MGPSLPVIGYSQALSANDRVISRTSEDSKNGTFSLTSFRRSLRRGPSATMTAAGLPLRGEDSPVCYAVGRVLRRMEYLVVDSALGTGLLAGKSNERPIAVLDDFLSAAELQPLLAQLPDNPNE